MMVVLVLMMSCQVSENPNIGPEIAQITMVPAAIINAQGLPVIFVTLVENLSKKLLIPFFFLAMFTFSVGKKFPEIAVQNICYTGCSCRNLFCFNH